MKRPQGAVKQRYYSGMEEDHVLSCRRNGGSIIARPTRPVNFAAAELTLLAAAFTL
jgi:hypothetical protein